MNQRRTTYNKLVRDRIPEIIKRRGGRCETEVLSSEAYHVALLDKLVEEAREAQAAPREHLATELADVLEVLDAIVVAFGLERSEVLALQEQRREERGGFGDRVRLLWTE